MTASQQANTHKRGISEGWRLVPLGEVCELPSRQVDPKDPAYKDLPHVNGENIESGTGKLRHVRTAAEDRMTSGKYLFDAGVVLYSKLRPYLSKATIVDFQGLCSADMYPIRPKSDGLTAEFLLRILLSEDFTQYAVSQSQRARMPKLNRNQLFGYVAPLPPLPEQKRIAGILKEQMASAEKARAAGEAQIEAARTLPTSYLRQAFRETIPLSVKPLPKGGPKGWGWQTLTDVARLESGHTPSRNHPEWWGGDIPWIALPDIRALHGRTATETLENTNPQGIANSAARVLPEGTVCLSRTASVGFVTIMGPEMATSQDFVNWVCGKDLDARFLMYLLMASQDYIRSLASGATHKTVYMPTVQSFRVCVPAVSAQKRIADWLDAKLSMAEQTEKRCEQHSEDISALSGAILRKAFNGEL